MVTRPAAGYYLVTLTHAGWAVPSAILLRDGQYTAEVDGVRLDGSWAEAAIEEQLFEWLTGEPSHRFLRLVLYGRPCERATYQHRTAMREWARLHKPSHPCLHPLVPMDPSTVTADDF